MIRSSIGILLVLMVSTQTAAAQTWPVQYQVLYELTYQTDSTNIHSTRKEIMELLIHDSLSVFQAWNKRLRDSIVQAQGIDPNKGIPGHIQTTTRHDLKYTLFGRNNTYLVQDNYTLNSSNDATYKYYSDTANLSWEFTDETDTLNGVPVQKSHHKNPKYPMGSLVCSINSYFSRPLQIYRVAGFNIQNTG